MVTPGEDCIVALVSFLHSPPPAKLEAAVQPRPTSEKLLSGGKMSSAPVPAPQQAGSLLQPLC